MKVKCFFGCHDWQTVSCKSGSTLKSEIRQEYGRLSITSKQWFLDMHYRKKICLDCGKLLDTIGPASDVLREEFFRQQNRRLKAKRLLRNSRNSTVRFNSDTWKHRCYKCGKCGQQHESF